MILGRLRCMLLINGLQHGPRRGVMPDAAIDRAGASRRRHRPCGPASSRRDDDGVAARARLLSGVTTAFLALFVVLTIASVFVEPSPSGFGPYWAALNTPDARAAIPPDRC